MRCSVSLNPTPIIKLCFLSFFLSLLLTLPSPLSFLPALYSTSVVHARASALLTWRGAQVRKSKKDRGVVMCGVVLESPFGDTDGTAGEWRYFICKPRHGIFVSGSRVSLVDMLQTVKSRVKHAAETKLRKAAESPVRK